MTHIVIHNDANDVSHYAEFDDLQAAAAYLEELVTADGESNARLFALEPVEFAVKSYVRVEIGGTADVVAEPPADDATAADPSPVEMVVAAEPTPPVEVFTDEPADDTVEYVEAAMAPPEAYAPAPPTLDDGDDVAGGEVRRGLFGR